SSRSGEYFRTKAPAIARSHRNGLRSGEAPAEPCQQEMGGRVEASPGRRRESRGPEAEARAIAYRPRSASLLLGPTPRRRPAEFSLPPLEKGRFAFLVGVRQGLTTQPSEREERSEPWFSRCTDLCTRNEESSRWLAQPLQRGETPPRGGKDLHKD